MSAPPTNRTVALTAALAGFAAVVTSTSAWPQGTGSGTGAGASTHPQSLPGMPDTLRTTDPKAGGVAGTGMGGSTGSGRSLGTGPGGMAMSGTGMSVPGPSGSGLDAGAIATTSSSPPIP